jgi:hypothetical protein
MSVSSRRFFHLDRTLVRSRLGKFMRGLHPHQRVGPKSERLHEPDRHFRGQSGVAVEKIAHRLAGDVQPLGGGGHRESEVIDYIPLEPRPGMDGNGRMKLHSHQ